jgi:hypothetical protein
MGNTQCFKDNRNRKDSDDDVPTTIYTENGIDKVMHELEQEKAASKVFKPLTHQIAMTRTVTGTARGQGSSRGAGEGAGEEQGGGSHNEEGHDGHVVSQSQAGSCG